MYILKIFNIILNILIIKYIVNTNYKNLFFITGHNKI